MAKKASPTLQVLREIRDELVGTNSRLDHTNARLDRVEQAVAALEHRVGLLEKRQSETEMRLATELIGVANAVDALRRLALLATGAE